jgi:hypothetical protein
MSSLGKSIKLKIKPVKAPAAAPASAEVQAPLERILESKAFRGAGAKLPDALEFIVGRKLTNAEHEITQRALAARVFGYADFDPLIHNMVRSQMRKLRRRLEHYYKTEGQFDIVRIEIPLGTYVPEIIMGLRPILIDLFDDWSPSKAHTHLFATVQNEIVEHLNHSGSVPAFPLEPSAKNPPANGYHLRGSLTFDGDYVRINYSLSRRAPAHVVAENSLAGNRDELIRICKDLGRAVLNAVLSHECAAPVQLSLLKRTSAHL